MVRTVITVLLAALAGMAAAAANPTYIEKSLGARTVRFPQLAGFPAACEENQALAERAAALAPKSSAFLTCFVEESKWRSFREGKPVDLYPLVAVTVVRPDPSGPVTVTDFHKLRQAAHTQLGDLLLKPGDAQARLSEQDARNAAKGGDLQRKNYHQKLSGFFKTPDDAESFSFLVERNTTLSEAGITKQLCEVIAVSTILFEGRLLGAMVIDNCSSAPQGLRVREITIRWLRAFSEANRLHK
jgi:hypothetical protein